MKLILYYFESCPYCQKVLDFIDDNNLIRQVELRDIYENNSYLQERFNLNMGGKQVPCLTIDGKPMLESDDIIDFLSQI